MRLRMDHTHDSSRQTGSAPPLRVQPDDATANEQHEELVRGPGRERHLRPMSENHTERFVVGPHRGAWGSGIWSVRRDGELIAVHPSQWEAMLDATERAYAEWAEHGARALVEVCEMDGRLVEARVFGPQRADLRTSSPVVLANPPTNPVRRPH
ncbi:MAG TPA: hypothetical protein VFL14_14515 [Xanthomonadales bacterium]|nr:hypothetical protein [Xanthomonadales bacterium]